MAANQVQVRQYFTDYKTTRIGRNSNNCRKISRNGESCNLSHIQRGNHCDRCTRCIGKAHETQSPINWMLKGMLFYLCYDCYQDKLANKRSAYDIELVLEYKIEL